MAVCLGFAVAAGAGLEGAGAADLGRDGVSGADMSQRPLPGMAVVGFVAGFATAWAVSAGTAGLGVGIGACCGAGAASTATGGGAALVGIAVSADAMGAAVAAGAGSASGAGGCVETTTIRSSLLAAGAGELQYLGTPTISPTTTPRAIPVNTKVGVPMDGGRVLLAGLGSRTETASPDTG